MLLEPQPQSSVNPTEAFSITPVSFTNKTISYRLPVNLSVMPAASQTLQRVGLPEDILYTRVAATVIKPSSPFGKLVITTPSKQDKSKRGVSVTLVEAQTPVVLFRTARMERRSLFGLPIGPVVEIRSQTNVTRF